MIEYAVIVNVPEDLSVRFEEYMAEKHIPEVLAAGSFIGAAFSRSEDGRYRISYRSPDRKSLGLYLETQADRLRRAFAEEFPFKVGIEREVLTELNSWQRDQS